MDKCVKKYRQVLTIFTFAELTAQLRKPPEFPQHIDETLVSDSPGNVLLGSA